MIRLSIVPPLHVDPKAAVYRGPGQSLDLNDVLTRANVEVVVLRNPPIIEQAVTAVGLLVAGDERDPANFDPLGGGEERHAERVALDGGYDGPPVEQYAGDTRLLRCNAHRKPARPRSYDQQIDSRRGVLPRVPAVHLPRLSSDLDDLVPPGSHTHIAHRNPRELLQTIQIGSRSMGKVGQLPGCPGGLLPPLMALINRLDPTERLDFSRHLLAQFTAQPVHGSNRDLNEGIEDVELGHGQPGESVDSGGIAHHRGIEPAAAPWPTGYRAKLATQLPQALFIGSFGFRRKRAVAHSSGICLDHAEHAVDGGGSDAGPNRRPARCSVGRGDVGVRPVVYVEQRPLGSFQQNAALVFYRAMQEQPSVR